VRQTDTDILDSVLIALKAAHSIGVPKPPAQFKAWADWIEQERNPERRLVANPTYQNFWRCKHHPEAIANWSHGTGWFCSHDCGQSALQWCDNGFNPLPAQADVPRGNICLGNGQPPNDHE